DGSLFAAYRPGAIAEWAGNRAYDALFRLGNKVSHNRGAAANYGPMRSGVGGSLQCRTTRFTAQEVKAWATVLPFAQEVARQFRLACPAQYEAMMQEANRTDPFWIISGTPFTTLTANFNERT